MANPNNKNRPLTERALRAHITTALGKESTPDKVETVVRQLRDSHVLTIAPGGNVAYGAAG